jgi:hypothetical protein
VSCTFRTALTGSVVLIMSWKGDVRDICQDHIPEIAGSAEQNHDKPQSDMKFKCCISRGMSTTKQRFQVFDSYARSYGSRNSVTGIATGYGLDDREVEVQVPVGSKIFFSPRRRDRLWAHQTSYPRGTRGSFPGGKAAEA